MLNKSILDIISKSSPDVAQLIKAEEERQANTVELIASENFASDAVRAAAASCLTNKYAEGYPGKRYYGGCECVDAVEDYCRSKWKEVFSTDYHVNVQPHSGTSANIAAYQAVIKPGDVVLSLGVDDGGHISHASSVSIAGRIYEAYSYGLTSDGYIDYDQLEQLINQHKPNLVITGASAYSREIDFARIRKMLDAVSTEDYHPYMLADIAHIAGLVAAGEHQSPFGIADVITTTTHKTLRGPRGALIFCKPELAKKVDAAIFPRTQGGPLMHIIAAKAIAAEEACSDEYKEYIRQVVRNAKAMAAEFVAMGYDVVTGGTDNHLFLLDLSRTAPNVTGLDVQNYLDKNGITLNKNCVPNEKRSPKETSGVRIGTPAMTTKGWKEEDFINCAHRVDELIKEISK